MTRVRLRVAAVLSAVCAALVAVPGTAVAHPLGNFTTNTYAGLVVAPEAVTIDYVVDLAEIPALRVVQELDADGDGTVSAAEGAPYEAAECEALADGITLRTGGDPTEVAVAATDLTFPPGEAGLATLRLECRLEAAVAPASGDRPVTFSDANLDGRIGWREVTAVGDGATLLSSDVPAATLSDRLRVYPEERLASPVVVTAASVVARPGGGGARALVEQVAPVEAVASGVDRLVGAFTDLVATPELTVGVAAIAVGVALVLGALHALAPGHGKTVMAAFLVSREGTARQALALGMTVAVTHTLGVLLLGAVLTVSELAAPDRLYAVLGAASGLLFTVVGLTLLGPAVRRFRTGEHGHHHHHGHSHGHGHAHHPSEEPVAVAPAGGGALAVADRPRTTVRDDDHDHDHHAHDHHAHEHHAHEHHAHEHDEAHHDRRQGVRWRSLAVPGLAGGLVPTPSALVVLLGGIALDRTWFGVGLVVAYGVGMAATLVAAGALLMRAKERLLDRITDGPVARVSRVLPVVTASAVVVAGLVITLRALLA